ncbi:MAG TPA: SDR family NAD(P)-dependent oxidoreductase [Fibrobacteria bacterium]|nr:SDR family NAD(P)-dependent oxidoreductase [Fibrobacteria bacterium]
MESIAVFGATSGIARAVAGRLAAAGESLVLIGRDAAALEALAGELEKAHGRKFPCLAWDVLDHAGHAARFRALAEAHPLRGVFMAAGVLFPQDECDADPEKTRLTFETNLTGPAIVLDLFAGHFRRKGGGFISAVSSVAGERGRGKVLAYAASKAGLTAYLAGLRHRLAGTGVFVQTIKPGFVRTRMTAGQDSPLMAGPERAARDIVTALQGRKEIAYTPWFWKWIMLIIRSIPAPVFRRMKL